MKKLSKILATALAMAVTASMVIMPITAEAASTADAPAKEFLFNNIDEITSLTEDDDYDIGVEFGVGGRMDNVARFYGGNGRGLGAGVSDYMSNSLTVEFMAYNPEGESFDIYPATSTLAVVGERYLTFDDGTDGGLFGDGGTYTIVGGSDKINGTSIGLAAEDKAVWIDGQGTAGNAGEGAYSFGFSKGADMKGYKHMTIEFDCWTGNSYDTFYMYPANDDRFGIALVNNEAVNQTVSVGSYQGSWTHVPSGATFPRYEWHNVAIEYNMNTGVGTIYLDGEAVQTYNGLTVGGDVPSDFEIRTNGNQYGYVLNNFYVYEGGYDPDAVEDPVYVDFVHKYKFDDDVTTGLWNANSGANGSWAVVPGTATGKAADDKVLQLTRLDNSGAFSVRTNTYSGTVDGNTATASVKIYQPSTGNAAPITMSYYANAASDSTGISGQIVFNADGSWSIACTGAGTVKSGPADANNLDKWHEIAVTMTKATSSSSADGTAKFYIDGTLMYTQTGLQINTFTKDLRVNSAYGNYNGSVHYIDDYFLYGDEYTDFNGNNNEESPDDSSDATVEVARYGMGITGDGDVNFLYGAADPIEEQAGTYNKNAWNKFAYTLDIPSDTMTIYLNGEVLAVKENCGMTEGGFPKDIRVSSGSTSPIYIDSLRVYEKAYDPSRDIAPADVTPEGLVNGKFLTTSSLSDVKAALAAGQNTNKVVVQVYSDYVGGTVATKLTKGCIAAVHSKSGDIVKGYLVDDPVTVDSVTLADGVLTGVVTNHGSSAIPAMTMILVEDGGKLVYSSETITNITTSATFTIEGLGSSLSNPEVFFVKDWTNPYAIFDEIFDVE